ncbi:MAG: hypothetical protein HC915_14060, partial [Anaerolineae bacterium]|nr:hypothetical protein [Anaerolineae bacterium]
MQNTWRARMLRRGAVLGVLLGALLFFWWLQASSLAAPGQQVATNNIFLRYFESADSLLRVQPYQVFSFVGEAGERVTLVAYGLGEEMQPSITVLDPVGFVASEDANLARRSVAVVEFVVPDTGVYPVIISRGEEGEGLLRVMLFEGEPLKADLTLLDTADPLEPARAFLIAGGRALPTDPDGPLAPLPFSLITLPFEDPELPLPQVFAARADDASLPLDRERYQPIQQFGWINRDGERVYTLNVRPFAEVLPPLDQPPGAPAPTPVPLAQPPDRPFDYLLTIGGGSVPAQRLERLICDINLSMGSATPVFPRPLNGLAALGNLPPGVRVEVVGRDAAINWLLIVYDPVLAGVGWIEENGVLDRNNPACASLPIIADTLVLLQRRLQEEVNALLGVPAVAQLPTPRPTLTATPTPLPAPGDPGDPGDPPVLEEPMPTPTTTGTPIVGTLNITPAFSVGSVELPGSLAFSVALENISPFTLNLDSTVITLPSGTFSAATSNCVPAAAIAASGSTLTALGSFALLAGDSCAITATFTGTVAGPVNVTAAAFAIGTTPPSTQLFDLSGANLNVTCPPLTLAVPVGDLAALVDAFDRANLCADQNSIQLATGSTYSLPAAHNTTANGANALPVISAPLVIDGNNATLNLTATDVRFLEVQAQTTISDLGFSNAALSTGAGGAIFAQAGLTLTGADFFNNSAFNAGAIYSEGTLTINGGSFSMNSATGPLPDGDGGAIQSVGNLTADGVLFFTNTAADSGGAIDQNGTGTTVVIRNSTFQGNSALFGGALENADTAANTLRVINSTFSANQAFGQGGAVDSTSGTTFLTANTLTQNTAPPGLGGGIYTDGGGIALRGNIIVGNTNGECGGSGVTSAGGNVLGANGNPDGCPVVGGDVARVDGWQKVWYLWWVRRAITSGQNPLYTDLLLWPLELPLGLQPIDMSSALLTLPVLLLVLDYWPLRRLEAPEAPSRRRLLGEKLPLSRPRRRRERDHGDGAAERSLRGRCPAAR